MQKKTWAEKLRGFGFYAIIVSAIAFVISGPGHRFGLMDLGTAFDVTRGAVGFAALSLVASLIGLLLPSKQALAPKLPRTLATIAMAGFVLFHIYGIRAQFKAVPPIHDISTDLVNPPEFVLLAADRANARNPLEYAGAEVAKQQAAAYPDIQPLRFTETTPSAVIAAAIGVAQNMGFDPIQSASTEGRLEATDTTFWYGYKDDLIVRALASGNDVIVDLRSKSRIGQSDLGKNAARVREFSAALQQAMR
ncbi:MAG: DUF1499 domain-containing protein [Pseudomonadota bacterium]